MMKTLELLVAFFLWPISTILVWRQIAHSKDQVSDFQKIVWAVFAIIPVVPFLYVLFGDELW